MRKFLAALVLVAACSLPAASQIANQSLGSAAYRNTGASGATVPLLNGANTWAAAQTWNGANVFAGSAATPYRFFLTNGTTTAISFFDVTNTGGVLRVGIDSSAGGQLATGSSAYAGVVSTDSATSLQLGANATIYQTITSAGATTLSGSTVFLTNIGADTALVDASLCRVVSTGSIVTGTGAAGLCLGTSARRFKRNIAPLGAGLSEIMSLKPVTYYYRPGYGPQNKLMYGFIADDAMNVLPALTGRDKDGRANNFDYLGVVPVLVKAMQEQEREITALRDQAAGLRAANDNFDRRIAKLERAALLKTASRR